MVTPTNSDHSALQHLEAWLNKFISAAEGEPWPETFTQDEVGFNAMLKQQEKFEHDVSIYFKDLASNRISRWLDWYEFERRSLPNRTAGEVVVSADARLIEEEHKILLNVVFGHIFDIESIAIDASSRVYNIPIDGLDYVGAVQLEARKYGASLAKDITERTRSAVRSSIEASIELGEDIDAATKRIDKIVNNPARAATITKTESVNSWGAGTLRFGKETGAKGKKPDVVLDERTSPICKEIAQKYAGMKNGLALDKPFEWKVAGGGSKQAPGFHVRCRTTHYLIY